MDIIFETRNSFLYIVACIVIAAATTFIVYYRNKETRNLRKIQTSLLYFLRFSSFFLLAILLLSPLVKTVKRFIYQPKIIIATDNSTSLLLNNQPEDLIKLTDEIANDLNKEFEVIKYTFGESPEQNGELKLSEKNSDYSDLVDAIYNNHFNENIGALVIIGDGIYNKGANPLNSVRKLNFPIYTIGIGDTSVVTDSKISGIRVNRTAFKGNKFPVEIDLEFSRCANQAVILQINKGNETVFRQQVKPLGDDYFTTIKAILDAENTGLQQYNIRLNYIENERNTRNNISQFVINVMENKQKVLILSEGPHPDMGAIKNVLEQQQNYEVTLITKEPYPNEYKEFNLVILNQLPSAGNAAKEIISKTAESKTPLLLFTGGNTFLPQLNKLGLGIEVLPQAGSKEEATPTVNKGFELFKLNETTIGVVTKFPPLLVPFAKFETIPELKTLFFQNIKNIETDRPLILAGNYNGRKIGFVFGEGIWRWRLYNYYLNESHNQFNDIINSLIQYVSLRENDDNFIIKHQPVYDETNPVVFNAEVYNELFQPYNQMEVTIEINDTTGNNYQFTFDKAGEFYRLDAGNWPVGNYSFTAKVVIGETEYTEKGAFAVVPVNIEMLETRANHQLLYQLANTTGGKFYTVENKNQITNDIKSTADIRPESFKQASLNDLLNLKWVFFVILLIFSLEWFLRKFWGIY